MKKKGLLFLIVGWIVMLSTILLLGQHIPNEDGKWVSIIVLSLVWFGYGGVAVSCDRTEKGLKK